MSYASYDMLTHGVNLTNSSDVVANSYSVIRGSSIVNILDLLPGGIQGPTTVDAYTKIETDIRLLSKADKSNTYTEVEVDTMLLATKALIDSKANTADVYNKSAVDGLISNIQLTPGATGARGIKGDTGLTGATGSQGGKGDTGSTGAQGNKGDIGATGAQGNKGDTGLSGTQGTKGDTGLTGAETQD